MISVKIDVAIFAEFIKVNVFSRSADIPVRLERKARIKVSTLFDIQTTEVFSSLARYGGHGCPRSPCSANKI
ncbi:MAG: hypothetical protein M3Q99_19825 [Acidobacteriota bacterium]|nr:hypothetical protein [Acidobacteriota bacterium]